MSVSLDQAYETHLTLDVVRGDRLESARRWAIDRGLKWTEIELSRGDHPRQPMITFWGHGSLEAQHVAAQEMAKQLLALGIRIVRQKIETAAALAHVATDGQYFECHVKLHLHSSEETDALRRVAETNAAHVSRNARRVRRDGTHERFLTLRSYDGDGYQAHRKVQHLIAALNAHDLTILETETELVVFDSNRSLDAGWEDAHV